MKQTQPPGPPRLTLIVNQNAIRRHDQMANNKTSQSSGGEDAFCAALINGLSLQVQSNFVRQFLNEILAERNLRTVLATRLPGHGRNAQWVVQAVRPVAEHAQRRAQGTTEEREAVYAATILLGVDYCFLPAIRGKYDAADALKTIVWSAVQRLDRNAPKAAFALRTCMRWGNFDEEDYFTDWLESRVHHAMDVLKLIAF